MAEGGEHEGRYVPGIVTFRPDNFLTVGLIFVIVYLAGAFGAQLLMRAGVLPAASSGSSGAKPAAGHVVAA